MVLKGGYTASWPNSWQFSFEKKGRLTFLKSIKCIDQHLVWLSIGEMFGRGRWVCHKLFLLASSNSMKAFGTDWPQSLWRNFWQIACRHSLPFYSSSFYFVAKLDLFQRRVVLNCDREDCESLFSNDFIPGSRLSEYLYLLLWLINASRNRTSWETVAASVQSEYLPDEQKKLFTLSIRLLFFHISPKIGCLEIQI